MQADASSKVYANPPKNLRREGWKWELHGAMNGMRTGSRDFTEFFADILVAKMNFRR